MSTIILDSSDTNYRVSNSNTNVRGATGTQAVLQDAGLTGNTFDANVERIGFAGLTTDYTYRQQGNTLQVFNAAGVNVAKIALGSLAETLSFANGSVELKLVPAAVFGTAPTITIGGQTVTTAATAAAVTIPTANIDVLTYPVTLPTFSVATTSTTATEGGNANFTVTLANPSATTTTTVKYTFTNLNGATNADTNDETITGTGVTGTLSTTTAGVDGPYVGLLSFAPGATTATISLPVAYDTISETGEGISLTLSNPTGASAMLGTANTVTTTFVDAPAPAFTITSQPTVNEGESITFTVSTSTPVLVDTVVYYNIPFNASVQVADFKTATTGNVTILAHQSSAAFAIGAAADNIPELTQNFDVNVIDGAGTRLATKNVLINDVTVDLTAPVIGAFTTTAALALNSTNQIEYAENQTAAGVTLGTVAATDVGGSVASFAITPASNPNGFFAINNLGQISLTTAGIAAGAASNDFETLPNSVTLGVTATDAIGNTSAATNVIIGETNVDDDAPIYQSATASAATIVLNFNEALKSTSADIPASTDFSVTETINGTTTTKLLAVTGGVGVNSGSVVLTLQSALAAGGVVKVSYTPGLHQLKDLAGNPVAAISNQTATTDITAPTLVSSSPADDSTNVAVASNVVLTFSEVVKAGTGNIVITNAANSADSRTIPVTDASQVTFSGATVTINPTSDLLSSANYYVTLASGVVSDSIGNAYAGITSSTLLNFATPGGTTGVTGTTFVLTQLADNFTGTGNDDTFNGLLDSGATTFSAVDIINGGNGVDTLNALGQSGTVSLSNVTNVEKFWANSLTAGAATINMGSITGETFVGAFNNSLANLTFSSIGSPATVGLGVTGAATSQTVTFNFDAATTTGSADTATLSLVGVSAGTVAIDTAANGIEKVVLNADTSSSKLTALTLGSNVSQLSLGGAAKLNIAATDLATTVTTIDASQNSGGVTVKQTGNLAQKFTGSSGSDIFVIGNTANLTIADTLNGGGGNDYLSLGDATTATGIASGTTTGVTSFEGLSLDITGITQDLNNFPVTLLAVGAAGNTVANATFTNVLNNSTINVLQSMSGTLVADLKTNTGVDALAINIGTSSSSAAINVGTLSPSNNYETVTVNVLDPSGTTISAFGATPPNNIIFTGAGAVTLTDTTNILGVVDLTGNTASNTVTVTSTASQTISFGAGNDTLTATGLVAGGAAQVINGGAGNDTLTAGAVASNTASLTLNGDAGSDTISTAAILVGADGGAFVVNGGAGIDGIVLSTAAVNERVDSSATTVADADFVTAFLGGADTFKYLGALNNGTKLSGVAAVDSGGAASVTADLSVTLAANANSTVFVITQDVSGQVATDIVALAGSSIATLAGNFATFKASLLSSLGTIAGLDSALSSTEAVLLAFDDNAGHEAIVRVTNTDVSTANTLTSAEVDLVGVITNTVGISAATFV